MINVDKLRELAGALNRMQAEYPSGFYVGFGDSILEAIGEEPGYMGRPLEAMNAQRFPRFAPNAELLVDAHNGPERWTGADWNAYVDGAERNCNMVTARLIRDRSGESTDPRLAAYVAARRWAADHGHQTPDDRMLDLVFDAGYGEGRDDGAAGLPLRNRAADTESGSAHTTDKESTDG